jgi:hypothetical protein
MSKAEDTLREGSTVQGSFLWSFYHGPPGRWRTPNKGNFCDEIKYKGQIRAPAPQSPFLFPFVFPTARKIIGQ